VSVQSTQCSFSIITPLYIHSALLACVIELCQSSLFPPAYRMSATRFVRSSLKSCTWLSSNWCCPWNTSPSLPCAPKTRWRSAAHTPDSACSKTSPSGGSSSNKTHSLRVSVQPMDVFHVLCGYALLLFWFLGPFFHCALLNSSWKVTFKKSRFHPNLPQTQKSVKENANECPFQVNALVQMGVGWIQMTSVLSTRFTDAMKPMLKNKVTKVRQSNLKPT